MAAARTRGAGARSSRAARQTEPDSSPIWARLLWLALAGVWVFAVLSLISFDAGDRPGHVVWPANEPAANWCGPVGAGLAYRALRTFGLAVTVPLVFLALWLLWLGTGRRVQQPITRFAGVTLLTAAGATGLAMLAPDLGPMPSLSGGTLGVAGAGLLLPRFGLGGSVLWLGLLTVIGLIVAADTALLSIWRAGPTLAGAIANPARDAATRMRTRAAERAAAHAVEAERRRIEKAEKAEKASEKTGGGLLAGLRAILAGREGPVAVRAHDLDDGPEEEAAAERRKRKPRVRAKVAVPAEVEEEEYDAEDYEDGEYEEEDGEEYEYYDEDGNPIDPEDLEDYETDEEEEDDAEDEDAEYEDEYEDEDGEYDDEDAASAPQVYTQEALREKIAKLPVRFATRDKQLATEADLETFQNQAELEGYKFPTLDLLEDPEEDFNLKLEELVREQAESLEASLRQYRIDGEVVDIESGPVITLYHVKLAPGTKVAVLNGISSDLARSLKAVNIRIVSNIEGRDTVGIEVPNPTKERVRLKELMSNRERFSSMRLPMFLGKDAAGDPLIGDLTKMPHMLIAGTTGSGKSVCMNTIIMSFLYTKKPNELKLVLVDPKMVEMSQFKDIPHLMCPVVTEMSKAAAILEWAVGKMDERYEILAEAGCRDIASYNALEWDELKERMGVENEMEAARIPRKLPYMVFVIDELADLMMTNKEVEGSIIRIAQKARAVGIHLILATQRPQANVVTGLIKSNMPCRITFKVASAIDSRVVLDQKGGELLLGMGDMLFLSPSSHKLHRAQGTLVDDAEIRKVVRFLRDIAAPSFERQLVQMRGLDADADRIYESENNSSASLAAAQEDPMFDRAVEIVLETRRGSVSLLQRRLAIGYTRASRLIDLMGIAGIIGEHKGSVAREVLISPDEWDAMKEFHERELARLEAEGEGAGAEDPDQQALFDDGDDAAAVEVNHRQQVETEPAPFHADGDAAPASVRAEADDDEDEDDTEYEPGEDDEETEEYDDDLEEDEGGEDESEDDDSEYDEEEDGEEYEEDEGEEEDADSEDADSEDDETEDAEDEEEDDGEYEDEDSEEEDEEYEEDEDGEDGDDDSEYEDEEDAEYEEDDEDAEYEDADDEEEYEEDEETDEVDDESEDAAEEEPPTTKRGLRGRRGDAA